MVKKFFNTLIAVVWWFYTIPRRYDQERRNSVKYKKKKKIVRDLWIGIGSAMLFFTFIPGMFNVVIVLALLGMGVSFIILDETDD